MSLKGMHKEDIKAAIRKKGVTLQELALMNGLGSSSITASLYVPSPTANKIISDFIGKPMHKIWPEWYDKNGRRIRSSKSQSATKQRMSHC